MNQQSAILRLRTHHVSQGAEEQADDLTIRKMIMRTMTMRKMIMRTMIMRKMIITIGR